MIGCMAGIIGEFDTCQGPILVDRVGHQTMLGNITIVPESAFDEWCQFRARVNFHLLCADYTPATLGLDAPVGGFRAWTTMPEHITVGYLEKSIRCGDRPNFYRLEENVVLCISTHKFATTGPFLKHDLGNISPRNKA